MKQNILLTEHKLNSLFTLKNKIVMAPMTRAKATDDLAPTPLMADYYARRADAGLIITEGTIIRPDALGYRNVPGIFTDNQINHWKNVTDKVHQNNGLIFMQIWHVGRVTHPDLINGQLPVSPSETIMSGKVSRSNGLIHGKSRAVTLLEIKELIDAYALAAKNAIQAGFDGVEIHGANGYLIDQFLHYDTNKRKDNYGGNPENMSRFALEVIQASAAMIGYERLAIRLSPVGYLNEIKTDQRDALVFQYLLEQLNQYPIAYIHTGNFNDLQKYPELNNMTMTAFIRSHYKGSVIGCGSYSTEKATKAIENNEFDLIAFGRPFIANPDLINLIRNEGNLKPYDPTMLTTLY